MFSSKFKYSSLILLLAVVVMFYSTALPFSAAVEPIIDYVPITIGIDEIAYFADQFSDLSYFSVSINSTNLVGYFDKTYTVIEDFTNNFGAPQLFEYGFLDNVDDIVYFYPSNFNLAFTFERGASVFCETCLYIPFEYYIGPETRFEVGTYFQSPIYGFDFPPQLEVYLMDATSVSNGLNFYGSSVITYNSIPIVDDFIASRFLVDILPDEVFNQSDVCRYDFLYNPDLDHYNDDYIGAVDVGFDEVFLTFFVNFSLSNYELNSEIYFPCLYLKPFTVYVREEIAPTVQDYLNAITNPSPESVAEVERLEQELEEISDQLRQDASDLEVEKPDISDSVENLPSEVIEGMGEASETVLSPLMTIDLIATLFSVLFGVVALKLILFGSGTA